MPYIKRTLQIIAILALVSLQISLISPLFFPAGTFDIVLASALFIVVMVNFELGLFFVLIGGSMMDIYSNMPFGLILLNMLATVFIINILFNNFFTNKSLYSLLVLGIFGVGISRLAQIVERYFAYLIKATNISLELNSLYFRQCLWQAILTAFFLAAMFYIYNFFQARLSLPKNKRIKIDDLV